MPSIQKLIIYGVIIGLLVTGLGLWINWSLNMNTTVANQATEITTLKGQIKTLQGEIDDHVDKKKNRDVAFENIGQDQVDLLCAARYNAPVPPEDHAKPTVVEVIKWRDRVTKCPTTDPERAEIASGGAIMRPVNDEIRVRSLNNSWKAYCAVTGNEEDVCLPFR
ncbi:hypothetical protein D9M68_18360 [compost metagenome]